MTTRVGSGRSRAKAGKELGERRNDLPQNHRHDEAGDHDDGDRINHRRLDLPFQLDGFFDVGRQPFENRVENTARLARRHHVREQVVERLGMLAHRVGQRGALFDRGSRLVDDLGEILVFFLTAENVEALHERQPGVDHHGELAGEHRQVLGPDRSCFPALLRLVGFGLDRRDLGDEDAVASQCRHRGIHRLGDPLAVDGLSPSRSTRICKSRHIVSLSRTDAGRP